MRSTADAIEAYLRAKDENRPFLMTEAFAEDASFSVVVHSDNIAFPPVTHGRGAITDVLGWIFALPYPWCSARDAVDSMPAIEARAALREFCESAN
jgi:hypothetical protein